MKGQKKAHKENVSTSLWQGVNIFLLSFFFHQVLFRGMDDEIWIPEKLLLPFAMLMFLLAHYVLLCPMFNRRVCGIV